jgi:lysophospholipase L1-like esterase
VLSQKRDDLTSAGDSSFVFTVSSPSAGKHSYRFVLGTYNTVEFKGLTLTGNSESPGETVLPDKPVYVAYGNSITHGQGQNTGDQSYPWVLAAKMGWELFNIAVGGSKTSVPMAEMLKNEVYDTIDYMTILIGYNDAIGYAKDTSYYREKLISFIDTVRKGHPETTIFVLGQTFTIATENKNGDPVNFDDWRKVQKYIVDSLTFAGDSRIHYLNGVEFTNYSSLNNPPKDRVHLSINGAYLFGNALADTIKDLIKKPDVIFTPKTHMTTIDVYPHPTSGKITVMTNDNTSGAVEIYSLTGEKIMTFNNAFMHSCKTTLDIGKLPRGLYFLKTGNGIKKIVKF